MTPTKKRWYVFGAVTTLILANLVIVYQLEEPNLHIAFLTVPQATSITGNSFYERTSLNQTGYREIIFPGSEATGVVTYLYSANYTYLTGSLFIGAAQFNYDSVNAYKWFDSQMPYTLGGWTYIANGTFRNFEYSYYHNPKNTYLPSNVIYAWGFDENYVFLIVGFTTSISNNQIEQLIQAQINAML